MMEPVKIKTFLEKLRDAFTELENQLKVLQDALPNDNDEEFQFAGSLIHILASQISHDPSDVQTAVGMATAYLNATSDVESAKIPINHDKLHKGVLDARKKIRISLTTLPEGMPGSGTDASLERFITLMIKAGATSQAIEHTRRIASGALIDDLDELALAALQTFWDAVVARVTDTAVMNGSFGTPQALADQICVHEVLDRLYARLSVLAV